MCWTETEIHDLDHIYVVLCNVVYVRCIYAVCVRDGFM